MAAAVPAAVTIIAGIVSNASTASIVTNAILASGTLLIRGRKAKTRGEEASVSDASSQVYRWERLSLEAKDSTPIPIIYGLNQVSGNTLAHYIGEQKTTTYSYIQSSDIYKWYYNLNRAPKPLTFDFSGSSIAGVNFVWQFYNMLTSYPAGTVKVFSFDVRLVLKAGGVVIKDQSFTHSAKVTSVYNPWQKVYTWTRETETLGSQIMGDTVRTNYTLDVYITPGSNYNEVVSTGEPASCAYAIVRNYLSAPSTSTTRALYLWIGVGEGEVDSIYDIRVQDQPITDLSSSVHAHIRLGESAPQAMPVLPTDSGKTTESVDSEITTTWSTVTLPYSSDSATLHFTFPYGCFSMRGAWINSKDYWVYIDPSSVTLNVEYQLVDTPTPAEWTQVVATEKITYTWGAISPQGCHTVHGFVTNNLSSALDFSVVVPFSTRGRYRIRIKRSDTPSTFQGTWTLGLSGSNVLYLDRYDLIVNKGLDQVLTYPRTAQVLLDMIPTEQLSGSVPNVVMKVRGLKVKNLSTNVTEFSSNPAWCLYDLLTNTRYGLGTFITSSDIDTTSFISAADYYDALVDDGFNGQTKRFELNIVLDSNDSALAAIQKVLVACRSFLVWSAGVLKLKPDKAEAAVQTFTTNNIIKDSLSYEYTPLTSKYNSVRVTYYPKHLNFERTTLRVQTDLASDGTTSLRETSLDLVGVTGYSQALRLARYVLECAQRQRIVCSFKAAAHAIICEPGDVIAVTHDTPIDWSAKLFRVLSIVEQSDYECELKCAEYDSTIYTLSDLVPGNVMEIGSRTVAELASAAPAPVKDLTLKNEYKII